MFFTYTQFYLYLDIKRVYVIKINTNSNIYVNNFDLLLYFVCVCIYMHTQIYIA